MFLRVQAYQVDHDHDHDHDHADERDAFALQAEVTRHGSFFEIADAILEGRRQQPPRRNRVPSWLQHQLERGLAVRPSLRSLLASLVFSFRVMHG